MVEVRDRLPDGRRAAPPVRGIALERPAHVGQAGLCTGYVLLRFGIHLWGGLAVSWGWVARLRYGCCCGGVGEDIGVDIGEEIDGDIDDDIDDRYQCCRGCRIGEASDGTIDVGLMKMFDRTEAGSRRMNAGREGRGLRWCIRWGRWLESPGTVPEDPIYTQEVCILRA